MGPFTVAADYHHFMPQNAPSPSDPLATIASWRQQASLAGQRLLVVAAGDMAWCRSLADALWQTCPGDQRLWLGERPEAKRESVSAQRATGLLGQERQLLVVDAHGRFFADAFGALSGTLGNGGLLLMLVPPLKEWPRQQQANAYSEDPSRFIRHLVHCIETDPAPLLIEQTGQWSPPRHVYAPVAPARAVPPCRSEDQQRAVAAILQLAAGEHPAALVITADRGRGKSAALGIAAGQLLAARPGYRIGVCAPRPSACAPVFERAAALLQTAETGRNRLDHQGGTLRFLAPDAILAQRPQLDLLLIDEAAALPVPILSQLLEHYPRSVFASTVHGYEGTGRGFTLRFARILERRSPRWRKLSLDEPIRWRSGDPLEQFVFRTLLLDAEPADPGPQLHPEQCRFLELDRDRLADDSRLLRQVFGLLVLAHYRTRPEDLQRLLDDPKLRLYVLQYQQHPVAVLVLAREGDFTPGLAEDIYLGRRRPRGHLLAQSLAFHAGVPDAARYRYGRVLRIGVHPVLQRRGLGSALLEQVLARLAAEAELDAVGASFSASAELLTFWLRAGFQPLRIGLTREHTSGQPALLVLKPLNASGASVYRQARQRFEQHWQSLRAGPLQDLEPALAKQLQPDPAIRLEKDLAPADIEDIESFVHGRRGYEVCAWPIEKLVTLFLADPERSTQLDATDRQLLTHRVMNRQDWPQLCVDFKLDGQKAARRRVREAVKRAWQLWEKS